MSENDVNISEGLINKIQKFLYEYYVPVATPKEAELHFSTQDIYIQLQKIYPNINYDQNTVAEWLHNGGFSFFDYGEMKFEWMMKKNINLLPI